ncbi:hypothetical protein HPP92_020331 [Vanilla planifolia]|uniref:H15 domain-containing protein n=1 Tax=Vanilla planifolia TaxID=51239 RepID=A0A835QAI2_VANPL|nr:hypothetical protein HPP92_020331 [Vanilla planifolia]
MLRHLPWSSAFHRTTNLSSSIFMADTEDSKSVSHTPYHEVVTEAITALGEQDGSTKSAILYHIETTYRGNLPANHEAALSEALATMKDAGDVLLINNKYKNSTPGTLPRRGRGRPPKPKVSPPPGQDPPTPRPRGRPPKIRDPLAVAVAKAAAGFPRSRGRPKKIRPASSALPMTVVGVKRGRGRPPKVRATVAEAVA